MKRITPTNAGLTDSEAGHIRHWLADAEIQLTDLDEKIAAARAHLRNLLDQRTRLRADISACKISLAPHKKLPPELLSQIFQYCVPDRISLPPKPYAGPLLLCQIFSYWRTVALKTPTLWNRITINFHPDANPIRLLDIAKAWLDRSQPLTSLSIAISVDAGACNWDPVQALINPYIRRCREIEICTAALPLQRFLSLPGGCTGGLEVFKAKLDDEHSDELEDLWPPEISVFSSSHRLHSFTIQATDRSGELRLGGRELLQLPCSQLTDLRLSCAIINPDVCLAILERCASLVHFVISVDFEQEISVADCKMIVVPTLRRFDLHLVSYASFLPFLRLLSLPALKDFRLFGCDTWSNDAFISLCSRSSFDLTKFTIEGTSIKGPAFMSLLQHIPSVVELNIPDQLSIDSSTLDMIVEGDLIPKLEAIGFESVSTKIALRIVKSRWWLDLRTRRNSNGVLVSRLREIVIDGLSPDALIVALKPFQEEGLRVVKNFF